RGHEFHYSRFIDIPEPDDQIRVWNARNELLQIPVFKTEHILASYFHFYFGDRIKDLENILFK
ncbi:MAG TPA: hypothetical protein VGC08_06005, partial [Pedobacter sp.]